MSSNFELEHVGYVESQDTAKAALIPLVSSVDGISVLMTLRGSAHWCTENGIKPRKRLRKALEKPHAQGRGRRPPPEILGQEDDEEDDEDGSDGADEDDEDEDGEDGEEGEEEDEDEDQVMDVEMTSRDVGPRPQKRTGPSHQLFNRLGKNTAALDRKDQVAPKQRPRLKPRFKGAVPAIEISSGEDELGISRAPSLKPSAPPAKRKRRASPRAQSRQQQVTDNRVSLVTVRPTVWEPNSVLRFAAMLPKTDITGMSCHKPPESSMPTPPALQVARNKVFFMNPRISGWISSISPKLVCRSAHAFVL